MSIARHPLIMFGTKPAAASGYLLDTYTGAYRALAYEQLKSSITSFCRLRRSSDDAETDVQFTSGITSLSLSCPVSAGGTLGTWVGANNAYVVRRYDQSGNANHSIQAITSLQRKIISAGVIQLENGKPAALSTGSTSGEEIAFVGGTVHTVLGIFKVPSTITSGWAWLYLSSNSYTGGDQYVSYRGQFRQGGSFSVTFNNAYNGRLNAQVLFQFIRSDATTGRMLINADFDGGALTTSTGVGTGTWVLGMNSQNDQLYIEYASDRTSDLAGIRTEINSIYGIY